MATNFELADYEPFFTGSGAEKLRASGVAPLVALARGYRTYPSVGEDFSSKTPRRDAAYNEILDLAKPDAKSSAVKVLNGMFRTAPDSDILLLPWYSAATVAEGKKSYLDVSYVQFRPKHQGMNAAGDSNPKYTSFQGSKVPVDVHVATPVDWLRKPRTVLITEGVLKGDSALSAQLADTDGNTVDDLLIPAELQGAALSDAIVKATKLLREKLAAVPERDRTLIISIVGVTNWKGNPSWGGISLPDTDALIAFDGDLHTNRKVWDQFTDLSQFLTEQKKATRVRLLDLGGDTATVQAREAGWDSSEKVGLDDYLAQVGTWQQVLGLATTDLPKPPAKSENAGFVNREVRVTSDGHGVEMYRTSQDKDEDGRWVRVDSIGGHVLETKSVRTPSREEIDLGRITPGHDRDGKIEATIRAAWVGKDGAQMAADIVGPREILTSPPERWPKDVHIPAPLVASHVWPPKSGLDWVRAVKANPKSADRATTLWSSMGWAPSPLEGSDPVYLLGNGCKLGRTIEEESSVDCGITEAAVSRSSGFAVVDDYWETVDTDGTNRASQEGIEAYKADVRDTILKVVDLIVSSQPWRTPAYGPIVLAAMLRPTFLTPWHGAMYLYGIAKTGKSYTSSVIMTAFGKPGTWTANSMPGGASDTQFATEQLLSIMPIWVMDDLAPGTSRLEQQSKIAKIDELVRQVSSGATRRAGSADGGLRTANELRSMLILTGEQEFETASLNQRLVSLEFTEGEMQGIDRLQEELMSSDGEGITAKLSAMMVRFWHQPHKVRRAKVSRFIDGEPMSPSARLDDSDPRMTKDIKVGFSNEAVTWPERVAGQKSNAQALGKVLQYLMEVRYGLPERQTTREANILADLLTPIYYLRDLYEWAGGNPEQDLPDICDWNEGKVASVIDFLSGRISDNSTASPGKLLVKSLVAALTRGAAHIRGVDAGEAPFNAEEDARKHQRWNESLGWTYDGAREAWVPKGEPIGYLVRDKDTGDVQVLFEKSNAYRVADRSGAVPAGQSMGLSWKSAETDKLVQSDRRRAPKKDDGTTQQVRGMSMSWAKFLAIREHDDLSADPTIT